MGGVPPLQPPEGKKIKIKRKIKIKKKSKSKRKIKSL